MRVSDYIVRHLESLGIDAAFMLAGGGMMHLIDALGRSEKIKYYCNHHEQAGTMAADAYARVSGKPGLSYATSGPGGTNTITGIVGSYQDSTPMIVITGQSKVSQTIRGRHKEGLRQFGVFEVDIVPVVESITKYSAFVETPESIRYHLEKACYLAQEGRPGPVLLDIPLNVQGAQVDPEKLEGFSDFTPPPNPDEKDLDELLALLSAAKRPLVVAGNGVRVSGQHEAFCRFIEKLNLPVVTTPLAVDLLTHDSSNYIGHPGVKGDRAGNIAMQSADLLICLGASLHVSTTGYEFDLFAPNAKKIMVDPDPFVLDREEVGVNLKIQSRLQEFFKSIEPKLASINTENGSWMKHCHKLKAELSVYNEVHDYAGDEINYYDLVKALSDQSKGDEIVVADAGSAFYVVGQAFQVKGNQRVVNSGSLGAMGFAVPATTGACAAEPQKTVICVTGEGSLQTNVHELGVIAKNKLNAKLFVVNNNGYISIRNTQNSFFGGFLVGTDPDSGVIFPDLGKLSEAYDIPYVSVKDKADLPTVVASVLERSGPVVCEVFACENQKILPTVSSVKLEDGSMKSQPLQNMAPFFSAEKLQSYMDPTVDGE